jgi:hypothetical protein
MTAITFKTEPRVAGRSPNLQSFRGDLSDALDAFAMYRMQRAVPASEQRPAQQPLQDPHVRLPSGGVSATPRTLTVRLRAARWAVTAAKHAGPAILGFAIFGSIFVAALALRLAIWVPALRG